MTRNSPPTIGFALGILVLTACGESSTEPKVEQWPPSPAASLADVPNTWITRAEILRLRYRFVGAAVTNLAGRSTFYIIDDSDETGTLQAYNVATNTWSESFPASAAIGHDANGAGAINGKIYVSGGEWRFRADAGCLHHLSRYDPATRKWSTISSMPTGGGSGVTGVINKQLYILTSCRHPDEPSDVPLAFYRYNPTTNQWATLANPTSQHRRGMGGVIKGKFYVVGGEDQLNLLEVYDPTTNTWTTKARMPLGLFGATGRWDGAGVALGGKLHVIGGTQIDTRGVYTNVRTHNVYDPATNTWSKKRPLPTGLARIVGAQVWLNGQARIQLVHGGLSPNNLQYIP